MQPSRLPELEIDPAQAEVALDGVLSVRSGFTARHGLLVTNLTSRDLLVSSGGSRIGKAETR